MKQTIEERATLDADKYVGENGNFGAWQSHRLAYIRVATEQDRIARAEERERCILMAQKYACRNCLNEGICDGTRMCTIKSNIRKAIEEGGNNGTES